MKKYVLITSAYNEENYLPHTIESVVSQTFLPDDWYIISDCSTDRTDEIINEYSEKYSFVHYLRRDDSEKKNHNFASKVFALNSVLSNVDLTGYHYIGILDADILLPNNYYEKLVSYLNEDEQLGLVGGSIYETVNGKAKLHVVSTNTVSGAVQFFRMSCFSQLGLFLPMPYGGEDSMMGVKANFLGWNTRTYKDLITHEQKFVGRSKGSLVNARFHRGMVFYDMGYNHIFMILKCFYRTFDKPFFIGSIAEYLGYFNLLMKRRKRNAPPELVKYLRKQQLKRLVQFKSYR